MVLVAHLALLVLDVLALRLVARDRRPARLAAAALAWLAGLALVALAGMALASDDRFEGSFFTFLGLVAHGLFPHGIPLLLAAAWLVRARHRALARAASVLALFLAAAALEGFVRGPRALRVAHHVVSSAKLRAPLRLVLLADLQTDRVGAFERRVLRAALAERPDAVLLAGDYVQARPPEYERLVGALNALLCEEGLRAPLGVYAVEGNVDRPGWQAIFAGLEARAFAESAALDVGELRLCALSFADSFDAALELPPSERFVVALGHAPDFVLGGASFDLALAGHTHGGQVQIPGIGPLVTLSAVPRAWASGRTELPGGGTLIVSRGVGMERGLAPRVRFLCDPEIVVIDLVPAR